MIDIHFPFLDARKPVFPLVSACGVRPFVDIPGVGARRFELLMRQAPRSFRAVPLEQAQILFYPHCFSPCREVLLTSETAKAMKVPCIFVKHGDDASPVHIPYGLVYKESQFASNRLYHERVIPAFVDDPYCERGIENEPRPYQPRPTVGFCGFIGSLLAFPAYYLTGRRQKLAGLSLRRQAIRSLRRSRNLNANLILRTQYWGGAGRLTQRRIQMFGNRLLRKTEEVGVTRDLQCERRVYGEFLENVLGSDYTLCVRGAGNYSYRFYETLAAGRIPVFINTDCVLPFEDQIPWKRHCVWVEAASISEVADALVTFHQSITPEAFRDLQLANRKLYEEYLTPISFYSIALQDAIDSTRRGGSPAIG